MSLFRNRHKKFENDLQKHLGNHEVKPTDALWNKLSQELEQDGFEQKVQAKLENYELPPHKNTWAKIEEQLPLEPKHKATWMRFAIIPFVLLFMGIGVYVGYEFLGNRQQATGNSERLEAGSRKLEVGSDTVSEVEVLEVQSSKFRVESDVVSEINSDKKISVDKEKISLKEKPIATVIASEEEVEPSPSQRAKQSVIKTKKQIKASNENSTVEEARANSYLPEEKNSNEAKNISSSKISNDSNVVIAALASETSADQSASTLKHEEDTISTFVMQDTSTLTLLHPHTLTPSHSSTQENDKYDEEKPSRFSVMIMVGMHNSMMFLKSPKHSVYDLKENIALRRALEKPQIDWSGGFYADFTLNEKWRVAVGISTLNFTQSFSYDLAPATGLSNSAGELGAAVHNPNDTVISGNMYSSRIHYSWTEFPVLFTYKITDKQKWNFELQGGLSYALLNAVDAYMISYDNTGLLQLKDKKSFPYLQNNWFASFSPALSYTLNKNVYLSFMPTFKASLNPMFKNNDWVRQHPYFVGLGVSLRKQF